MDVVGELQDDEGNGIDWPQKGTRGRKERRTTAGRDACATGELNLCHWGVELWML